MFHQCHTQILDWYQLYKSLRVAKTQSEVGKERQTHLHFVFVFAQAFNSAIVMARANNNFSIHARVCLRQTPFPSNDFMCVLHD